MEGCRWKWAANGPEQASGADEAMELAAFVDQLQPRPRETPRPLVLRAALDYWHPYPRWKNGNSG
jgi:hypothetical protein